MRRAALLLIALAALLAGCGGDQIAAEEVPVDPPVLTIPSDPDNAPGASTADEDDASAEEDADADEEDAGETATADPAASGGAAPSGGTTSSGGTGGAAATPAPTAAPTEAPAENTGGATADEGLDQFCADNPGAC